MFYFTPFAYGSRMLGPCRFGEPTSSSPGPVWGPGSYRESTVSEWWDPALREDGVSRLSVIDSGEVATFQTIEEVPKEVWAVTYTAIVTGDSKDVWSTMTTVTNQPTESARSDA
jgi:hypothetical protein